MVVEVEAPKEYRGQGRWLEELLQRKAHLVAVYTTTETWLTCPKFVEYDQRNHRLHTLASFSFWVSSRYLCLGKPSLDADNS